MKRFLIQFLFLLVVISVGCSDGKPKRVPVSGKVLIDGQPLTCGTVTFIPKGHRASHGIIDANGLFSLTCYANNDGAVTGEHKIEITAYEMVKPTLMRWHAPKKYQDRATSGLSKEITGPTDDAVIELSWDGGKPFDEAYAAPGGEYKNADAAESK